MPRRDFSPRPGGPRGESYRSAAGIRAGNIEYCMHNPWLDIPLADYEAHMALPEIGQARLLSDIFADALRTHVPDSVAVIGCAGGNGLERISPECTTRVVGVDLNPDYLKQTRQRFDGKFQSLELIHADIERDAPPVAPVRLVFAALVLEYVNPEKALPRLRDMLAGNGVLITVLQRPSPHMPAVSPSPFESLRALDAVLRHIEPACLSDVCARHGLGEFSASLHTTDNGKQFQRQCFCACQTPGVDSTAG